MHVLVNIISLSRPWTDLFWKWIVAFKECHTFSVQTFQKHATIYHLDSIKLKFL